MKFKMPRVRVPEKWKRRILFAARILSGALFFYSGFSKLIQPSEYFEVAIGQYALVPDAVAHYVALIIPWIELIGGTFLFFGYMQETAAGTLAVLTGVFQIVLGQAVVRRLPIDECGCFGGGFVHLTLYQSFVLDSALVLFLIQLATSEKNICSLDNILLNRKKTEEKTE